MTLLTISMGTPERRTLVYMVQGHLDKVITGFNKAIELDPSDPRAYNNRAVAYFIKTKYEAAWGDVHKAQNLGYKVHPAFLNALRQASGRKK
jgi:Flp pilus assembly protein TadD